jgi:general secretion pathway protein K
MAGGTYAVELSVRMALDRLPVLARLMRVRTQSGVALILVLWMLALLSVIAGNLVFSSRTTLLVASNLYSRARAEALADAGVHKAMQELTRPPTDPQRWKGDGRTHLWNFQGETLRVTLRDESAKVDLNTAPTVLLKGLFRAVGVADPDADALADAVADWRDTDDLRSLHGAEKADYAASGRDYGPSNAPFETIEELRQVMGMSDDLFRKLEPLVTVHSRQAGINSAVAPREVLLALPGATPEQVDFFLGERSVLLEQGLPAPAFPGAQGLSAGSAGLVFSIQVEVQLSDNVHFFREAVVRLTGNIREPPTILAWRAPAGFTSVQAATAPSDAN